MWGMKQILLIMAVVIGQSVLAADEKPLITNPIVEKEVRRVLKKPEGKLTEADLEKVAYLGLPRTQITDAGLKDVAKLQWLTRLYLRGTKITTAGVAELKKALPKCTIHSNPKK